MNNNHIQYTREIPSELAGLRLDQALSQVFPEFSRSRLKDWLFNRKLRIAGKDMRPRDKVMARKQFFLKRVRKQTEWQAEAISLNIVHEDESMIVINKPVGLVVHPAAGHEQGTWSMHCFITALI